MVGVYVVQIIILLVFLHNSRSIRRNKELNEKQHNIYYKEYSADIKRIDTVIYAHKIGYIKDWAKQEDKIMMLQRQAKAFNERLKGT